VAAPALAYAIVFDEVPQCIWEFAVGSWWLLGVSKDGRHAPAAALLKDQQRL